MPVKSFKEIINDGIRAEKEAIKYYTFLLPFIHNGNERRSVQHILREEKEHLETLRKMHPIEKAVNVNELDMPTCRYCGEIWYPNHKCGG